MGIWGLFCKTPQADQHVKPLPWRGHDSAPRKGPNSGLADAQKKRVLVAVVVVERVVERLHCRVQPSRGYQAAAENKRVMDPGVCLCNPMKLICMTCGRAKLDLTLRAIDCAAYLKVLCVLVLISDGSP